MISHIIHHSGSFIVSICPSFFFLFLACWSCGQPRSWLLLAAAHLLKFLGWARPPRIIPSELSHGHPNPLTQIKKRGWITFWCSAHRNLMIPIKPRLTIDTFLSYPHTVYASDTVSETTWFIADYRAALCSVHISSYCLISRPYGATRPLSPFPRRHLHLLLYPFRKMFALFYWWLRGI